MNPSPGGAAKCWSGRCWVIVACLTFALTAAGAAERVTFVEIASTALGRRLPMAIISPALPKPADEAPVLILLHGRGRNHRSLIDAPAARAALLAAPFHIVLPQGEDGWYIDSPAQPADRYGAYLEEVVAWVEQHVPAGRSSAKRGIAGWSMGGYGAVRFAQTHPERVGFVASVIGLLDFPRAENLPEGQNYRVPANRFTADPAVWTALNPIHNVDTLRGRAITLVLATRGFERTMNENFIAALAARNITPTMHWLEGGHEFSLVERALPLVLADAAAFFAKAATQP